MPVRGILRSPTIKGLATPTHAPLHVDSDDNLPYMIPAGSGTTLVPLVIGLSGVTGVVIASGTGTLVSGVVTVATGLTTVKGFSATVKTPATGTYLTGVTEVHSINVTSITTGAVSVQGVFNSFVTGAATASVSGTAPFWWVAIGT
jgi:hypothetical protein